MKYRVALSVLLASSALSLPALQSQDVGPLAGPSAEVLEPSYFRVQRELESWRASHGESWRVVHEARTGFARMIHGGSAAPAVEPLTNDEFRALAREFLVATEGMHGIEQGTLVDDRVAFLPLGLVGSSDKVTVRLRQVVAGVPVVGASVNVLFDAQGRLLSIDSNALPALAGSDTAVDLDARSARSLSVAAFGLETGLSETRVVEPRLVFAILKDGKLDQARLAWESEVFHESGEAAAGWRYRVDARTGEMLQRERALHHFDVSGQVRSLATPGTAPDLASNPETSQPMPYLRVTSAQGNAVTDVDGNFTIPGASAPLQVTVAYEGTYAATDNVQGADYSLTTTLNSSSGNTVTMNPAGSALATSEANSLNWIGLMREWTRTVNPTDATSDFLAASNVNLNDTCNAFYNGISVNFYPTGGGCVNTSYSSVVLHEMGHWMNDLYSSGNGSDGFGEGNADVFSMYILDDPIVGLDFCGTGCNIRTGENTRQFCGDCCGGCHGGVHANGEVLGGALWKVRKRLKTSLGSAPGGAAADALFNAWMNAYDDTQIQSIIEVHWLTLDDDDGNIDNGTPHYADIDAGFQEQGFPGYALPSVVISSVTQVPDSTDETGPYVVDANIVAAVSPPLVNPTLHWRANGGAFQALAMAPTGGDGYRAQIPGQASPTKVEYYVEAEDSLGVTNVFPSAGAGSPLKFLIGVQTQYFFEDFEGGLAGWTHAQVATQDDWQRSSNVGLSGTGAKSGDPANAFSGSNVWGNDLGPDGWNGAYADNVENWLRSPGIDLSGAVGTTLRFQRWLTVERGIYDRATIRVDGVEVWANPNGADLIDTAWTATEVDIAAEADGKSNVVIEFRLESDGGVTFGGWNIDDVELMTLEASCGTPTASNPVAVAACPGDAAMFSTLASGSGPFTYQWNLDGLPIAGATSSIYSIPSASAGDVGSYSVVVTGACGFTETSSAALSLNTPVSASAPSGASVCEGAPLNLSTSASGSGPLSYQWRRDGGAIAGATSANYTIASVSAADAGLYTVDVTGACGTLTPAAAAVVVNLPTSASDPADASACSGSPVSFDTTAGGSGPFSYQWKKGGSPIAGATSSSFSIASVDAADAGTYSVEVTGACGTLESASALLSVDAAPDASAPSSQVACEGDMVAFSTSASGTGPFTYQWKKDGLALPGETAANLLLAAVLAGDAGAYSVEVTGPCGSVEPAAATLGVNLPVTLSDPLGADVCAGDPVAFGTTAGGSGPFSYQWKKDGLAIPGATGSSYAIPSASPGDAGGYSVEVTGACGSLESSAANLGVGSAPSATTPSDSFLCEGSVASFSTLVTGSGPFSFQWKKDGVAIPGATSSSFAIASVVAADSGSYSVEVSGACGSVESGAALLGVNVGASASDPLDEVVCAGGSANFSTTASGAGPLTFQWKKDGVELGGETSSSLTIAVVSAADAGAYSVFVSGPCGSVETAAATLDVLTALSSSDPLDVDTCVGGTAIFDTSPAGTGPFSFQWKKDGLTLVGETGSSLVISSVLGADAGDYSVEVSGACGSLETASASLDVSGATSVYCTAKVNSQGCTTSIGATGIPSESAGSGYHVTASQVIPNTNGLFFYSTTGADALPFQGGFLCIAAPAKRTLGQNSGGSGACAGTFDFDFNVHIAGGSDAALVAGAQFWGQIWSRDPNSPSTTNLTDAITATLCP